MEYFLWSTGPALIRKKSTGKNFLLFFPKLPPPPSLTHISFPRLLSPLQFHSFNTVEAAVDDDRDDDAVQPEPSKRFTQDDFSLFSDLAPTTLPTRSHK